MTPVAVFSSPIQGKFGVPRQSCLAEGLPGEVRLLAPFKHPDALRGLDGFDYIWLIWGFSLNGTFSSSPPKLTVRPPRLGGNVRVGVFASRSPFRPNGLGLSSVKIAGMDMENGVIRVLGADLADGTPIYDIKPYVEFSDSHVGVRCGFVDTDDWQKLDVEIPEEIAVELGRLFDGPTLEGLRQILAQDPRPQYQDDPEREYGLAYKGHDIKFKVASTKLLITKIS